MIDLRLGDCREVLLTLPDNSVDSVVTDPPYCLTSITKRFSKSTEENEHYANDTVKVNPYARMSKGGFMGKEWDNDIAFNTEVWTQCLRVLKPGGHLLSFGGTRTYHRMVCAIEDAGFEIRDEVLWIFGQGFPKSEDVSRALDEDAFMKWLNLHLERKAEYRKQLIQAAIDRKGGDKKAVERIRKAFRLEAGLAREVIGQKQCGYQVSISKARVEQGYGPNETCATTDVDITAPSTPAAKQWQGWGTSLKPAHEKLVMARKPLTYSWNCAIMIQNLVQMEAELCEHIVSIAEGSSQPIQHGSDAAKEDSAPMNALTTPEAEAARKTEIGQADGISWEADTSASMLEAERIALNMISSWKNTLDDALILTRTCTTETASGLTTDLKTWNLSLSQITLDCIIRAVCHPNGLSAPVSDAEEYSNVVRLKSDAIHKLIAQGLVTGESNLHPNVEPICLARKPIEGTVANNVLKYGVGGINVDGCRVGTEAVPINRLERWSGFGQEKRPDYEQEINSKGRFPANLILDGSEEVVEMFPNDAARFFYSAKASPQDRNEGTKEVFTWESVDLKQEIQKVLSLARDISDALIPLREGSVWFTTLFGNNAAGQSLTVMKSIILTVIRLTTALKISNYSPILTTRGSILDAIETLTAGGSSLADIVDRVNQLIPNTTNVETVSALGAALAVLKTLLPISAKGRRGNIHSTVKPVDLMCYLCRLITPKGGTVLDPFMGSGSTGKAAQMEGFNFIGIELDPEYFKIAKARIEDADNLFTPKEEEND